jgi:hypothetical protein
MMKGRSWNLQGMESIENSMDLRTKEKHEEEHEDSKKERKNKTISHCIEKSQDYQPDLNSLKSINQRN